MTDDSNDMNKFGELMQQAQLHAQKLQAEIEKTQEELGNTQATGNAGAGMVKVTMNGRYYTTKVEIDHRVLRESPETVGQLMAAAFNNTVEKIQKISQKMVSTLAGSMQMPGNFNEMLPSDDTENKEE